MLRNLASQAIALVDIHVALLTLIEQGKWVYLPGDNEHKVVRFDRVTGAGEVLIEEAWRDKTTDKMRHAYHWEPLTMGREEPLILGSHD